jgi:hypothetical protein
MRPSVGVDCMQFLISWLDRWLALVSWLSARVVETNKMNKKSRMWHNVSGVYMFISTGQVYSWTTEVEGNSNWTSFPVSLR